MFAASVAVAGCYPFSRSYRQPTGLHVTTGVSKAVQLGGSVQASVRGTWLIVGLGNPGNRFKGTRHNVGFAMIDAIAKAEEIDLRSIKFKATLGKGSIGGFPVMLAKPKTMDASGESVRAISSYYKIPLNQVLVILDDLDLPFAKLCLVRKGGHGGHNGMQDIISCLKGNEDIPRLRIGIGRPPFNSDAFTYVLSRFNKSEEAEMDFISQIGMETVRILLKEGFNKSATFVNSMKSWRQQG